jgi:hypothetical protein
LESNVSDIKSSSKWYQADQAFNKGVEAYIEFGQALAALNAEGTTQEEIGVRYQMSQQMVGQAIKVGSDKRLTGNTSNLPKSQHSLYLLTTLDDDGFEKLAKPETTQADIKAYKEAIKPAKKRPAQAANTEGEDNVANQKNKGYLAMAEDAGLLIGNSSANARNKVKEAIQEATGINPSYASKLPPEDHAKIAAAISDMAVAKAAKGVSVEDFRAEIKTLSETAQQKLGRLEKTLRAKLQEEFEKAVREEARKMVPDIVAQCEKAEKEATEEFRNFATRKQGIKPHLTEADYRFLRQTIAPDRYPEEYREKLTRAAAIINQFDKYVEAFKV